MDFGPNEKMPSQRWLLAASALVPMVGPFVLGTPEENPVALPYWLRWPSTAFAVSLFVLFLLPNGGERPLQRSLLTDANEINVFAEPWSTGVKEALTSLGASVLCAGISFASEPLGRTVSVAVGAFALIAGMAAHARHRVTAVRLSKSTLEVSSPTAFGRRSKTIALREVTAVDLVIGLSSAEINFEEFVARRARLAFENGSRLDLPLPMRDSDGDFFVDELRRRARAARAESGTEPIASTLAGDDEALRDIVRELAERASGFDYRSPAEITLDDDGCGFAHVRAAGSTDGHRRKISMHVRLAAATAPSGRRRTTITMTVLGTAGRGACSTRFLAMLRQRWMDRAWVTGLGTSVAAAGPVSIERSRNGFTVALTFEGIPRWEHVHTCITEMNAKL